MIKRYDSFINENMDMAKSIIAKKMSAFEKLKNLLSKNMGYIGKFTEYLMDENIKYEQLVILYDQLLDLKNNKNTTVDISKLKYESALDKIQSTFNDLSIKSLINKFPSAQKEIARKLVNDNKSSYNIFLQVSKKDNLDTFVSKISRYKDSNTLFNALKIFSKDPINDREKVIEKVDELDSKVVFSNDNILIVNVVSEADIKILAPDTSWCIVHSGMWKSYTTGRDQFILYDYTKDEFDPTFKIGFTLNKNLTTHAAHDILDKSASNILNQVLSDNNVDKGSFIENKYEGYDISTINSKTKLTVIDDYINVTKTEDLPKLLTRVFDVFGGRSKNLYELTINKSTVLNRLVNKCMANYQYLSEKDCNEIEPRLYKYVCNNSSVNKKVIINNIFDWNITIPIVLSKSLDVWSDQLIINNLHWVYTTHIINKTVTDFSKPVPDSGFVKGREITIKFSNRLNKIYKENKVKVINSEATNKLNYYVILLNYLLDRKEECPDREKLFKLIYEKSISKTVDIEFPGLFSNKIDLTGKSLNFTSFSSHINIPYNLIVKKDYSADTTKLYFDYNGFTKALPKLMKQLEGYKIPLRVRKDAIRNIKAQLVNNVKRDTLDNYQKKVLQLIEKFPERLVKETTLTDGNLSITVVE